MVVKFRKLYSYKYQLIEDYTCDTEIQGWEYEGDWFSFKKDGTLTLKKGYAWNGANCFPDIDSIMEPSAVHDALYQLGRLKVLPYEQRVSADMLLYKMCLRCGMDDWLANWVFAGVNVGGEALWREDWNNQHKELEILEV
jgi:hypothetical protein